ncbi:MAG: lipoyl synthase [Candidatus Margulisiibacteriota bacterium]
MQQLPEWLIKRVPKASNMRKVRELIGDDSIHTVCESASCPNIGECFSKNTATFMILGDTCTRACKFCGVEKLSSATYPLYPIPLTRLDSARRKLDPNEPNKVALASKKLGSQYIVITSVTRDDLPDQGAGQFILTVQEIRKLLPEAQIELLVPDFWADKDIIAKIVHIKPNIFAHNIEMVPSLYGKLRPSSDYFRSLDVLRTARELDGSLYTKSGFMLGLGEKKDEVIGLMKDLRSVDCNILTIGQYLQPSKAQTEVREYIHPDVFAEHKKTAEGLGFKKVISGPFVRSSYRFSEE